MKEGGRDDQIALIQRWCAKPNHPLSQFIELKWPFEVYNRVTFSMHMISMML